jgi:alanine racemase
MAVVKADGYGHGAVPISRACELAGVRHFAVARPGEGAALREAGIEGEILVFGAPLPQNLPAYAAHDLSVTVASAEGARAVIDAGPEHPLRVHLNVDTGMGRIGVAPDEAPDLLRRLREARGVAVAGLWTHFATADEPGSAYAAEQRRRFNDLLRRVDLPVEQVHIANTGALLTMDAPLDGIQPGLVRAGISLYGLAPTAALAERAKEVGLRPAMRLTARVTHVKTVAAGTSVSYGARWRAERPTRIATVAAGYADGFPRLGTGRASVRIGGEVRPVVGTICMDMFMVDLGPPGGALAGRVDPGDEVLLFGPEGPTAYDVATWAETIPYEIYCGVGPRVPRRYV